MADSSASVTVLEDYVYIPLTTSRLTIRLLMVWIDARGILSGKLRSFNLEARYLSGIEHGTEQYRLISYKAISYTWGSPTPGRAIIIDGKRLVIRDNLYQFLLFFAHNGAVHDRLQNPCWIWVDQICIEQQNIIERNHQVRHMGRIFQGAVEVLVWLGLDKHGELARRTMQAAMDDKRDNVQWLNLPEDERIAMADLFHGNPYWKRLWVVQEVKLAKRLTFLTDQWSLDITTLRSFLQTRLGHQLVSSGIHWLTQPSFLPLALFDVLASTADSKCEDPRDKIFGLQSLLPWNLRTKIDYSRTPIDIFVETVAQLALESFDQHILEYTTLCAQGLGLRVKSRDGDHLKRFERVLGGISSESKKGNMRLETATALIWRNTHLLLDDEEESAVPGGFAWISRLASVVASYADSNSSTHPTA